MLQPTDANCEAISYRTPGRSCATISTTVLCVDALSSNVTRGSTTTFGREVLTLFRPLISDLSETLPVTTSEMLARNRSHSGRFISRVRKRSVKTKLSTTTPAPLEKASALTIFIPHAASAPVRVQTGPGGP